jgi:arginase family enzyme
LRHLPEVISACQAIYRVAKACATTPEINPILDDGNRTAELAVELIASLLGQRIL